MDSKGTVALATGLGALGVIAAYYGYSHINNDDDGQTKPSPPTKESAVGSTTVLRERAEQQKTNEEQQKTNEEQQKTNEEQQKTNEEQQNIEQNVKLAISELKEKRKVESHTEKLVNNNNNNSININRLSCSEEADMSKSEKTDGEKWREYWAQQFVAQTEEISSADYN